jgi:colanic acid/amylovoran biosynthesis glycosyltransferase
MSEPNPHPTPPPRIAFLTQAFPRRTETFVANQVRGLSARGFEVEVLARESSGNVGPHRVRTLGLPRGRAARLLRAVLLLARRVFRRPLPFLRLLSQRLTDRWATCIDAIAIAALLLDGGAECRILHAQFGHLGPAAAALKQAGLHRGPVVVSFRGYDLTRHLRQEGPRAYELLFRVGDLFLPVCERFAGRLRELGCDPGRIRVHRSGVDLAAFPFTPATRRPGEPLRLVSVGRLVPKKGMADAVSAVALLRDRDIRLEIVGDGPLGAEIRAQIRQLDLESRVQLFGGATHEQVRERLAASHVFLLLSASAADGDQEGIPNTLKEAMATGLPVIGTEHSGIPELIEDGKNGMLVPERDPAAAADRIRALADRPEHWPGIQAEARRTIEAEYDAEGLNDELARLYRELLAGPGER